MGKVCSDAHMDAMLANVALADRISILSAEPANAAAIPGLTLATTSLTPGDGNGDFTIADGDVDGRKLTVGAQSGVSISSSGTGTHVAIDDGTNMHVTTCPSQVLTSGGDTDIAAYDIEVGDPG